MIFKVQTILGIMLLVGIIVPVSLKYYSMKVELKKLNEALIRERTKNAVSQFNLRNDCEYKKILERIKNDKSIIDINNTLRF